MAGVTVSISRLNERAAEQHLLTPVVTRGSSIRSMTLTIPLAEAEDSQGRGRYLVVEMPSESLQELTREAQALPESRRASFIRSWIMGNQQAILDQYLRLRDERGGETIRRFRYDLVPARTDRRLAVPSRREESRQPVPAPSAAVPRRSEQPARPEEPPPLVVRRRPRTEDGPSAADTGPLRTSGPGEVSTGAPEEAPAPTVRPRESTPDRPSQIIGGRGTRASPYRIRPSSVRRARGSSTAASAVEIPIRFDIESLGNVHFQLELTANQLTRSNFATTATEVRTAVDAMLRRRAASSTRRVDRSAIRDALPRVRAALDSAVRTLERDSEMATYLRGN